MAEQGSHDIITVVLTAENHLGYNAFGQHPRKREERLQRLRLAFQQATDFAVGQGVDLFIQAGDLFDTPNPAEQDRSFVAARLAELRQAGIRTFALSGMHDTPTDIGSYIGNEDYMAGTVAQISTTPPSLAPQVSYARLGALHYFPPLPTPQHSIFIDLEPVVVDVHGSLLALCGLSVVAGQEGDPLAKVHMQSDIERAAISLLILHAPIEGLASEENIIHDNAFPMVARSTIAGQSSFSAVLAGYHHAYQYVRIGHTDVIVAGATQHIDFSDPDADPGFVFLGLAADGIRWCHHIPGDALHLRRLVIYTTELWRDVTGDAGTTSRVPTDAILERLRPLCTADSMVQLQLVGELSRDQYHQLDLSQLRRYGEEHCFELVIDESHLSLLPMRLLKDGWQRGFASTAAASEGRERPQSANRGERVGSSLGSSAPSVNGHSVPVSAIFDEVGERLSPREELVNLADEWIAAADDEQEKKALIATKEELLSALDRMKTRR